MVARVYPTDNEKLAILILKAKENGWEFEHNPLFSHGLHRALTKAKYGDEEYMSEYPAFQAWEPLQYWQEKLLQLALVTEPLRVEFMFRVYVGEGFEEEQLELF